ncbi:hypothetical protein CRE_18986 [Caenorhabditis remanei]|uniref:Uncharacterized protein n=1 Tax=Caenorhabditis remanei TaxID=31234 RepID=E3LKY0_CAERE|nr:hypothetical protein CRE_18986 [Caenorhabditis remanei]
MEKASPRPGRGWNRVNEKKWKIPLILKYTKLVLCLQSIFQFARVSSFENCKKLPVSRKKIDRFMPPFRSHLLCASMKRGDEKGGEVPRTIATVNRRCMCQLPPLLGFTSKSLENFQGSPKILGFYKKQPGEAPLSGLTKHRTPIEMVFCTIHDDAKSLHSHLACQGTANLVVDACTHIWNGSDVIPMSKRLKSSVKDFYLRHSMTGHFLAISYRPCFSKLASSVDGKFIEVPLNQENPKIETALPRSHSNESFDEADYIKTVRTATSAIDQYFTGHILCGVVVLHYEPIPKSVTVIEKLDQICVRPVYFSKENRLRSRVLLKNWESKQVGIVTFIGRGGCSTHEKDGRGS